MPCPNTVYNHPGGQRIIAVRKQLREFQTAAFVLGELWGRCGLEGCKPAAWCGRSQCLWVAADEHFCVEGLVLLQRHQPDRRTCVGPQFGERLCYVASQSFRDVPVCVEFAGDKIFAAENQGRLLVQQRLLEGLDVRLGQDELLIDCV